MPAFRQPRKDSEAADVLRSCFPGREIIPIDCLELVGGLGTSTLHLPAATRFNDMKMLSLLALGCSVALLSACESDLGEDVHAALAPREAPRSRVFQADTRTTYEAARARPRPPWDTASSREGRPRASSTRSAASRTTPRAMRPRENSTQISMRVRLSIADPSGTEVSVSFAARSWSRPRATSRGSRRRRPSGTRRSLRCSSGRSSARSTCPRPGQESVSH